MKSHLQSYPCPLQINSFWNLGFLLGITIRWWKVSVPKRGSGCQNHWKFAFMVWIWVDTCLRILLRVSQRETRPWGTKRHQAHSSMKWALNMKLVWNTGAIIIWKFYNLGNQLLYLGFSNSIHQEVASDSFCFLINSSWLLVFILFLFLYALGLNLYCWKGIHFS